MDQIRTKSNTGRIIIDKTIADLGLKSNIYGNVNEPPAESNSRYVIDKNGKIIERKKKGRLYSLGGNEPKKSHLVRMKTVGTFDLCMEVTAIACGFNQNVLTIQEQSSSAVDETDNTAKLLENEEECPSLQACSNSISPKRQRHISSSDNSLTVGDSSINLNTKKKFRSLSSNSYVVKRGSDELRSKSADLLDKNLETFDEDFNTSLTGAVSATDVCNKSENNIFESFKNELEADARTSDDEYLKSYKSTTSNIQLCARRRTFKKTKKVVRTDSEIFNEKLVSSTTESSPATKPSSSGLASRTNSSESSNRAESSKNFSTDTVFSDMCEEEQIDLEKLESEYKEHLKSNLQREYKSDGDSLDEIGKDRHQYAKEWKNQSVDFEFLENDKVDELLSKPGSLRHHSKKLRNASESRTKSEGDKDTLYQKADSTETQSTEDENKIETDTEQPVEKVETKVEKHQSLFEKRFGKLKKMNKLLKVKRFSTSALYDKKKNSAPNISKTKESLVPLAAVSQVNDFTSSKTSLASPKSLKGKRLLLKKRKFSFFGKSHSNNDLNINLKSIASKLSLLSKSNFDLSKNSSNLRLNAVGIYGKYGNSNEYRSDIITKGVTSPLSEAFYNATGSYQLTPLELFEKFCSQDFTGLYKHEPISEAEDLQIIEPSSQGYKGAIKKSGSLRKATLLKQNSEPKFALKSYPLDQYFASPHEVFEEEEIESVESEEDEEYVMNEMRNIMNRRSSYGRQLEFDQHDHYYVDPEQREFYENSEYYENPDDEDVDEIYLMPDKHQRYEGGYLRSSDEILAIDETDEEILEDSEELLDKVEQNAAPEGEAEKEKLFALYEIAQGDEDFPDIDSNEDEHDNNLKTIISEYVKNACASSADTETISRSKSMDLLSNSSETLKTNSNSEYAFDTVKQIHLDSCSTSKLSLSLNSDIFDDITLAAPLDSTKTIKICEMDDFTLTPDGSMSENANEEKIAKLARVSEQQKIKNELQSQYTIIDCDELEHDEEDEIKRFNDDKSSFAEALNKEFDKLFSRAKTDSDTDITTTPSGTTVLTAIKMPS